MKEIIISAGIIERGKIIRKVLLSLILSFASLFLLSSHVNAQIIYQDISPDLNGSALTQTVLGQAFQWGIINGNQPSYFISSADPLIMVNPAQANIMNHLDDGDSIKPASAWSNTSSIAPNSTTVTINSYLGFRVGTPGNYRYGWFKVDMNSSTSQWVIKSYAYEQTPNKLILAGDAGNGVDDNDNDDIEVTAIAVEGQGGVGTANANGGTLQMVATVTPSDATHPSVTWSVQSGTGTATISETGLLTGQAAGTVTVIAEAQDGSDVSGTKTITISGQTTGIADINRLTGAVYPNPAKAQLILQFEDDENINGIIIRNLSGQVVYEDTRTIRGNLIHINVGFLPEGYYMLTYQNAEGKQGLKQFIRLN